MENMFEKMANQDPLRERLMRIMRKYPQSVNHAAKNMDLSPITLARFLRDKQNAAWVTLCKIEDYIISCESRHDSLK